MTKRRERARESFLAEYATGFVTNYYCHSCHTVALRPVEWGKKKGTVRMQCRACLKIEYRRWAKF